MSREEFRKVVEYVLNFYMQCGYEDFEDVFKKESDWNNVASDMIRICDKEVWV